MKSKDESLKRLSLSIGNFIRYWGFRRIHGAIWTQLYLSKTPLGCAELTKRLGLSKALISPALEELCKFKLIYEVPAPNDKVRVYRASENISDVIQHVLKTREAKMLKQISKDYASFSEGHGHSDLIDDHKVKSLGQMIVTANVALEILVAQKDILSMSLEVKP